MSLKVNLKNIQKLKVFHLFLSRIEAFHLQNGYYQSVCNLLI